MAAKISLTAGLHTGPGEAGPDHCVESINWFSDQGRLKKRSGMMPADSVPGLTVTPYIGWGVAGDPTSVVNVGTATAGAGADRIYVGYSAAWNRCVVYGSTSGGSKFADTFSSLTWEYWNGSAWTTENVAYMNNPIYDSTNDINTCAPYVVYDPAESAIAIVGTHIDIVAAPKSDWATKTINGQTLYWRRLRGFSSSASMIAGCTAVLASCTANATENRVLNVTTWTDVTGSDHRFIAYLYGSDGTQLRFQLDGTVLTQSDGLQPLTTSVLFGEDTEVLAFYHPATDRLIGRISGHVWFYLIPGNSEIYNLAANITADGTPYASVPKGNRGAIPQGRYVALHDGRFFVAEGENLFWSAPAEFPDIWPNQNEIIGGIADGNGEITGMLSFGGTLAVFKRNSVYTVQSDGSADGYEALQFPGGVGAIGGIVGCGNFCLFLAEDGVWQFDGGTVAKLSGAIDEAFRNKTFSGDLRKCKAVYAAAYNQYRVYFPSLDEGTICDKALYVDLTGYTFEVRGEERKELSIWPQGRYALTDYGFNMTAVFSDSDGVSQRVLCGDIYGIVWELDQGLYEVTPVKARLVQAPIGVGRSTAAVVTWVNLALQNTGNVSCTMKLIPETIEANSESKTVSVYKATDSTLLTSVQTLGASETLPAGQVLVERENAFAMRTRMMQIALISTAAGAIEVAGIEIQANAGQKRGER